MQSQNICVPYDGYQGKVVSIIEQMFIDHCNFKSHASWLIHLLGQTLNYGVWAPLKIHGCAFVTEKWNSEKRTESTSNKPDSKAETTKLPQQILQTFVTDYKNTRDNTRKELFSSQKAQWFFPQNDHSPLQVLRELDLFLDCSLNHL